MFRNFLIMLLAFIGISISAVPASARDMNFVVACRDTYLKDHQITEEGARHLQIGTTVNGLVLDGTHLRTVWGACIKQADTIGIVPVATARPVPIARPKIVAPAAHATVVAPKVVVPAPQPKPVAVVTHPRPVIAAPAAVVVKKPVVAPVPLARPAAAPVAKAVTAPVTKPDPIVAPVVKAPPAPATKQESTEYTDAQMAAFLEKPAEPAPAPAKPAMTEASKPAPQYVAPARTHVSKKLIALGLVAFLAFVSLIVLVIRGIRRKPEAPDPTRGRNRTMFDTAPSEVAESPALHAAPQEAAATAEFLPIDLVEEEAPAFARPADIDEEPPLQIAEEEPVIEAASETQPVGEVTRSFSEPAWTMPEISRADIAGLDDDYKESEKARKKLDLGHLVTPDPLDGIPAEQPAHKHAA